MPWKRMPSHACGCQDCDVCSSTLHGPDTSWGSRCVSPFAGAIITEAFATSFPTVIAYVIDTPRCVGPQTFMTNMLQVWGQQTQQAQQGPGPAGAKPA